MMDARLFPVSLLLKLIRKDPDAGKGLRQEGQGVTKDEMVGWHH